MGSIDNTLNHRESLILIPCERFNIDLQVTLCVSNRRLQAMIARVSEFSKAALDGVYPGMYWAFHTVRCVQPAILVLCRCGNASGDLVTEFGILPL